MKTIWKFYCHIDDTITLTGPAPLTLLHVAPNGHTGLTVWAEVDTSRDVMTRDLVVVGTGNLRPDEAVRHVTSLVAPPFVWHVYDAENRP